jgi:hypothetical protein
MTFFEMGTENVLLYISEFHHSRGTVTEYRKYARRPPDVRLLPELRKC